MFFSFFSFLKFWFFRLLRGKRAKNSPKWKIKITSDMCLSQEQYSIWSWFLVNLCKMMISPSIFFQFFKILIFRVVREIKNGPKSQKTLLQSICHEPFIISLSFMVHLCEMMISLYNLFFQNLDFLSC